MTIRWDALLTRHLAAELNDTFSGARLRAIRLDGRTRDVLLFFRDRTLLWRLHPDRGYPLLREAIEPESTDLRLRSRVRSVHAPDDERLLNFELTREKGAGYHELIVEVLGTQMNAIVTEGPERTVRHALRTRDGRRPIRIGHPYLPPPPTDRKGISGDLSSDDWESIVGLIPAPDRPRAIVRKIAWTSPLNTKALCDAENGHALWRGWAKASFPKNAWVLASEQGSQPYPFRLPDSEAVVADNLLDAFRIAVEIADRNDAPAALTIGPGLLARLEEAVTRADRRVVRLQAQLDQREEPTQLRATGDLILARYSEIPASATTVTLIDFVGEVIEIALDPALAPHDNAARFYDRAARSERAASRLPGLIEQAVTEQDHMQALLSGTRDGSIDANVLKASLPTAPPSQRRGDQEAAPPYRRFKTTGGLEVRVGRGARHNDDLTFRHSAPNDIWLHARHSAGAHVILRWPASGNPPARDLEEAGALAALHSKARTSATAPVDWTLRKHVRKPRGSKPGSVVPDRVKTLFVEPDEMLLERLLDEGAEASE